MAKPDSTALLLVLVCNLDNFAPKDMPHELPWKGTKCFQNDFRLGVEAAATILFHLRNELSTETMYKAEGVARSCLKRRAGDQEEPQGIRCICRSEQHEHPAFADDRSRGANRYRLNPGQWPDWMSLF